MARVSRSLLSRSAVAAYLCICVALLLLLALTTWGSYRDTQFLREALFEAEIDRLRSHAERTVGRIERDLEVRAASDLEGLDRPKWLQRHWERLVPHENQHFYAAVVNADGEVLLHSDPSRRGRRLGRSWYDRVLGEVGSDVFETHNPDLTLSESAYDVRVPIELNGREVAEYHVGFDIAWFDQWTKEKHASFLRRHALLIGGVLLIVLLATTSLYYIASHSIMLRRAVESASIERASEVGKLAAGLAHEIRNPLHAIQINLHTFRRSHEQKSELPPEEVSKMLEESTREIDRVEQLMRQLVGFATPSQPTNEVIDLTSEIQDVVEFIQQEIVGRNIELRAQLPSDPVRVNMDRGRLRQIMLNLLQNAQQAMESGGYIDITLGRRRGRVEITVADNGPGISEEDRDRIFEPFYSTKPDGSGLGLALVKRFIDESEGDIHCESSSNGGVTFRIILPEARSPRQR